MENMLRFNAIKSANDDKAESRFCGVEGGNGKTDEEKPLNVIRQFPERPDEWKTKRVKQSRSALQSGSQSDSADGKERVVSSEGRESVGKVKTIKRTAPVSRLLYYLFKLKPAAARAAREMKLKIVGAENLKALKSGVIALSNSESRAAYAVMRVLGGRKFRMVYDGRQLPTSVCGRLGKAGLLMPYGGADFDSRAERCLRKGVFLLYHPEKTFEWQREEPGEFLPDAFECAARLNLPVVPMFIAYQPSGAKDSAGAEQKYVTLFVLPAVQSGLDAEESKRRAYAAFKRQYENFYGEKLD